MGEFVKGVKCGIDGEMLLAYLNGLYRWGVVPLKIHLDKAL